MPRLRESHCRPPIRTLYSWSDGSSAPRGCATDPNSGPGFGQARGFRLNAVSRARDGCLRRQAGRRDGYTGGSGSEEVLEVTALDSRAGLDGDVCESLPKRPVPPAAVDDSTVCDVYPHFRPAVRQSVKRPGCENREQAISFQSEKPDRRHAIGSADIRPDVRLRETRNPGDGRRVGKPQTIEYERSQAHPS